MIFVLALERQRHADLCRACSGVAVDAQYTVVICLKPSPKTVK